MQAKHPFIAVDNGNHSQSVPAEDSASISSANNSSSMRQSKMDSFLRSAVPMSNEKYLR